MRSGKHHTFSRDEGNRPGTTAEGLAGLAPVRGEDETVTAGNASQLSDGASACVVMNAALAERRRLEPLGVFRGFAVAGCEPDEMGIGPVFAVPRLLERHVLRVCESITTPTATAPERALRRCGDPQNRLRSPATRAILHPHCTWMCRCREAHGCARAAIAHGKDCSCNPFAFPPLHMEVQVPRSTWNVRERPSMAVRCARAAAPCRARPGTVSLR